MKIKNYFQKVEGKVFMEVKEEGGKVIGIGKPFMIRGAYNIDYPNDLQIVCEEVKADEIEEIREWCWEDNEIYEEWEDEIIYLYCTKEGRESIPKECKDRRKEIVRDYAEVSKVRIIRALKKRALEPEADRKKIQAHIDKIHAAKLENAKKEGRYFDLDKILGNSPRHKVQDIDEIQRIINGESVEE